METYLNLFEDVIKEQAEHLGAEVAFARAREAGLGVSKEGHIVSCTGNPQLVLLRLIKSFTSGIDILSLQKCAPLIDELLGSEKQKEAVEPTVT